jgi:hypothetical protein
MKKLILSICLLVLGTAVFAQTKIQFRSANKAECVKSDMKSLKASFSFSTMEAENVETKGGQFSRISLPNTVIGGNEGEPQIPVVNQLIAVPFGATPSIRVTSFNTTEYALNDYGIQKLMPRQPDLFKNEDPKAAPFVYNEAAYQRRGLCSEPLARVSVKGTLRGVQVGQMSIEPVSYDPVSNTLRVFNNIEVEVYFDGADAKATEDMLVKTYSPYFDILYKQLFNSRAIRDVYEDHPDLWKAPVKMLVIANRMFESCIQDWVAWKTLKGIYVDVNYTDDIGTTADAIKSFIQTKYAQDAPTFLVIMGDQDQVVPSVSSASNTSRVSDLYYSSVDGDEFVDMFHSRMSAQTVAEMTAIMNKGMEYEQYTMPDPSYLNNVLLIAGEDSGYGVTVGRPTIWYASYYYYNSEHGFSNVYEFSQGTYTNCYAPLSSGVGFANYTAHGSQTSWAGPSFSVSDVSNLTNEHKYFYAMGNCCQSGDWGYNTCFGESLIRAENKGAFAYIGSCPNTTWYNDYYFGVGATTVNTNVSSGSTGTMPTMEQTTMGCYDGIWTDDAYNTVNSVLYTGLLACNAAEALGYEMHSATLYYWQAYHCLGDGSIMPYRVQPTANNVSHMAILPIGMSTYEVSAVPGSYVAISKDGVLHGTALVDGTGTVQVPITPVTSGGDVTICVTAPNRIPYIQTVPAAALEGAYITADSYTPTTALVGVNTNLSITFKNVGTVATSGTTNVTLTCSDDNVNVSGTGSFGALAPEATATVDGFTFSFNDGIALGTGVALHYTAVNGSDTWEGNITISPDQIFTVTVAANNANYGTATGGGEYHYNQSCTVNATPADGYMFTSWAINGNVVSTNASYTFKVTDNTSLVASFEEGVMIGSGTETNTFLPSYNYYTNSLTEQIYTSDELGSAGLITSIAFYNAGAEKSQDYDIYMKATTKSSFSSKTDWIAVSAEDKVFSGTVTMVANDWITFTFSTPFVYDGISNVVLVTDKSTQWTSSPHMSCRVFTTTSNQAIYAYDDNVNFDPLAPSSSSANSNDVLAVKNQLIVTKSSMDGCVNSTPSSVVVGDITGNTANVTWTGYSESYNVCYGTADIVTSVEDFSESIPAGWSNSSSYPWTIVDGYMQSGNAGVASSTSSISATVTYFADGTIDFDAECMGEGTSYDKCIFLIDNVQQFSYGANVSGWNHYTYNVSAGEHTFTWTYSKDSSVNPTGDYFAVDNVEMVSSQIEWNTPVAVEEAEYTITGLTPTTNYCVRVQGVCDGVESAWSTPVMFTTGEGATETQTITLLSGWNWWSTYLDINLAQLETLVTNHATNITSLDNGSASYNSNNSAWFGSFTLDPAKMYKINATEACELSMSAVPVNPAEHEVTINSGISWIGYPLAQAMSVDDALSGLTPEENDVIKTSGKMAMYSDGYWEGSLTTLEPGKGYIYRSRASQAKTFFYPSSKIETVKPEIGEPLFWNTTEGRFADNMNVVAVVEIDGQEALSDNIEIGAFVGDDCRGSVRLSRSASTGRYLAFLTIQGTDDETVSFRVLDGDSQRQAKEVIRLRVDNVVGNVKSPFTLHVGSDELSLFPNPANRDERVHIALPASARLSGATVEVYNALGALVSSISASGTNVDLDAIHASGVYTVKVTDSKGNVSFGKLVVR